MKIVAISDTHNQAHQIEERWPDFLTCGADVFIHAGDATNMGRTEELLQFARWLEALPFKHKIFVPGNHDLSFQKEERWARFFFEGIKGLNILIDQAVEIDGVKFYGNPWTPNFFDWAFMEDRGSAKLQAKHDLIPEGTDVLVCHGPPMGILDFNGRMHVGCEQLLERIDKVKPKLTLFGHIHEGGGVEEIIDGGIFANLALVDRRHQVANKPKMFQNDPDGNWKEISDEQERKEKEV